MEASVNISNKDAVINNIIAAMGTILNTVQLSVLENTVRQNLRGMKIEEECTQLSTWSDDNEHMITIFLANKKIEGCKQGSLEQYKGTAKQFFRYTKKNFRDITKDDVKLYLAYRMQTVKPTTARNSKLNLSTFFGWLHSEGYIKTNPVTRGGMRADESEQVYLTPEEEVMVRDAIQTPKEAAMIDFLLSTGVRVGELVEMDISDVDFSNGTVTFQGEKGSRKYRTVLLDATAKKHLMEYINTRTDCNLALFVTDRCYNGFPKRMERDGIEKLCKKVGVRAGLEKNLTVHVFRRTFATRLADQECPLETIQALMGHSKPETTQRYIARSRARVIQAAGKYFKAS